MRDSVKVVHESGRVTTVPRRSVKALARSGWRLVSDPEQIEVTNFDDPEPEFVDGPTHEEQIEYRSFRGPFDES